MFKLSIKIKVLIILLLLTTVMIIGMAINMHNGFNKGFFNYRKAIERQFQDNLISTLEVYFDENNDWSNLLGNKRLWHELVSQSSIETDELPRLRPPPPRHKKRKPRDDDNHNDNNPRVNVRGQRYRTRLLPPVNLFNQSKKIIIGMKDLKDKELIYRDIIHNGKVVGYLGLLKNNDLHQKQDQLFVKNIKTMLLRIGLIMIVLSVLIAFPIAKYFTKLINQINKATQKVAAGDYSIRVDSNRKDELGALATNFNHLAQSLESSSQSQKRIIADIAHELRTPISVIVGEIEAIQDGVHVANEDSMSLLHSQISSLKNLVNDLHDLSESDLGSLKYKMQEFDLMSLLEQCYQSYQLKFSHKNILLELKSSNDTCFITGDVNRLNQLFNNLLSNSVQYTDNGGKTQISLSCQDDSIDVVISDSSPGLNSQQIEKMFDRWYRADKSRNKNLGGSGLGLSICKEIVKAHNGKITAKQSSLGGIEITIKLSKSIIV